MPETETLAAPLDQAPEPRSWLERLWSTISERLPAGKAADGAAPTDLDRAILLADALLSERGEASGAAIARELNHLLASLPPDEQLGFMRAIASNFSVNQATLAKAAEAYLANPSDKLAALLARAAEPPRQELLRRMNLSPGGTAMLVKLRERIQNQRRAFPELQPLDDDLLHLFGSWFNRGFLELRRIDWNTSAAVLEKLIEYEAVHQIAGWEDLRRRLGQDRRCFGFFHPALPNEPLIFVEVALTEGIASAIQPLLAPKPPARREDEIQPDTAIFYSISNCQAGLRGVSFGNFLIKHVVEELNAELPGLSQFSTLSPVPGFRAWFERKLADDPGMVSPEELAAIGEAAGGAAPGLPALLKSEWQADARQASALRAPLLRACAAYLTQPANSSARAFDPVARFHLGNGARLERINWLGNTAPRGISESYGIMVNYLYDLDAIEANHETFVRDGAVVCSAPVRALLAPPPVDAKRRRLPLLKQAAPKSGAKA
jgi:malonyl-CoA decarboxylase